MMELKDTIDLMKSDHHENRFLAEYRQTKIRYEKLHRMIVKYYAGKLVNVGPECGIKMLDGEPKCGIKLLEEQAAAMGRYLKILEIRAEIDGIDSAELMGER